MLVVVLVAVVVIAFVIIIKEIINSLIYRIPSCSADAVGHFKRTKSKLTTTEYSATSTCITAQLLSLEEFNKVSISNIKTHPTMSFS